MVVDVFREKLKIEVKTTSKIQNLSIELDK